MTESHRIGSPPQAPQGAPPPQPRPPWTVIVGVAVLAAAAAAAFGIAVARHDNASAGPAPSATASAGADTASAVVTCLVMTPLLDDSAREVTLILEDPSRSTATVDATAGQLRVLEGTAPAGWRADIATQYQVLEAVAAAHGSIDRLAAIDAHAFADSGSRLVRACLPYATP